MKSDWTKSTIGEVCVLVTDGSHFSPKSVEKGRPMVSVKDFTEYGFNFSSCKSISEEDWLLLERNGCVPCYNDILIGKDGARYFEDIIIYRQDEKPALLSSIAILRCDEKVVIPEFLYHMLRTPSFRKDVRDNYGSGSAIPRIILKDFKRMPVFYPPLETQRKIAAILSALDDKIELNRRINTNLEQQARALYRAWFVDYIPFKCMRPSWKEGKLKEVLILKKNAIKSGTNTELPYLPIDSIPMKTFAIEEIRPNEEAQSSLITFNRDDIVIGAMRVYFHRVIIAPFAGITRSTCFVLSPIHEDFLSFAFLTCDMDSTIDFAQNSSKGSTMPYAVWEGGMGEIKLLLPPREVAKEFNKKVLPLLRQIQKSYFECSVLKQLRDALLPRLMSGEIDVSDVSL